jgi:hypothetical protein
MKRRQKSLGSPKRKVKWRDRRAIQYESNTKGDDAH